MSKRKLRIWDQVTVMQAVEHCTQFVTLIEAQATDSDVDITELPRSMVPTETIYDVASCLIAMYEKLLEEDLINSGYPKTNPNKEH